jgi:hypothetical protein
MSKVLKNLTLPRITEIVETVLETYPEHPYQQAFSNPDTQQQLLAFVLSRVQSVYGAVDNAEDGTVESALWGRENQFYIESVTHQGIQCVFNNNCDTISHQLPAPEQPGLAASHWFG